MARSAGSIRSFSIDGIGFDVAADGNLSDLLDEYENSVIATSGRGMPKKMKRVPTIEGVVLVTSGAEKDVLQGLSNSLDEHSFSVEYASGDIKKISGIFNIESDESEENRTAISLQPTVLPTRLNA